MLIAAKTPFRVKRSKRYPPSLSFFLLIEYDSAMIGLLRKCLKALPPPCQKTLLEKALKTATARGIVVACSGQDTFSLGGSYASSFNVCYSNVVEVRNVPFSSFELYRTLLDLVYF